MGNGKERNANPEDLNPFKFLRLIGPKEVQKAGISAEGPVFISPLVKNDNCYCGVGFSPVTYQTGRAGPGNFSNGLGRN